VAQARRTKALQTLVWNQDIQAAIERSEDCGACIRERKEQEWKISHAFVLGTTLKGLKRDDRDMGGRSKEFVA